MPKIFISYRRSDASESASRLHDILTGRFGAEHIFWDYDSIHGGDIFSKDIQDALNSSTTLLAVIGRDWLTIRHDDKRRLDDPKDVLRREIATALERAEKGEDINVIPVLVEGASIPPEHDLPDDLKNLVEHLSIEIRPQHWQEDVKPLLRRLEKDFQANFLYSFYGGSIGGLVAGIIVGWLYYHSRINPVGPGRIFYGGLYGLFSGALLSYSINSGITWGVQLLNKSRYSKIIGATAGGTLGGILAGIVGGFLFAALAVGGGIMNIEHLALAVASTSIFITLGILLQELKGVRQKTVLALIISVCMTLVAAAIAVWTLRQLGLAEVLEKESFPGFPFSKGVLILGSICGVMSGFQVGSTLFVYDHFKIKLGYNP